MDGQKEHTAQDFRAEFFGKHIGLVLHEVTYGSRWYPDVVGNYISVIERAIQSVHDTKEDLGKPYGTLDRMRGWTSVRMNTGPSARDILHSGFPELEHGDLEELCHLCSGRNVLGAQNIINAEQFYADVFGVLAYTQYAYLRHEDRTGIFTFYYPVTTYHDAEIMQDVVREYLVARERHAQEERMKMFEAKKQTHSDRGSEHE